MQNNSEQAIWFEWFSVNRKVEILQTNAKIKIDCSFTELLIA